MRKRLRRRRVATRAVVYEASGSAVPVLGFDHCDDFGCHVTETGQFSLRAPHHFDSDAQ
jgi:hypothetical protein